MADQTAASAPFRQVDPLIAAPPAAARPSRSASRPSGSAPTSKACGRSPSSLVVLFHADLGPFGGGFIGVDVFFVVSGFLITSLLLARCRAPARISLANFWARRARRLLPASCLVIVATLLAASGCTTRCCSATSPATPIAACGFVDQPRVRREPRTAATSTPSWPKSPLLHFWSLAVEEQFYLVWPSSCWWLARDGSPSATSDDGHRRPVDGQLVACVWLTDTSRPWAFYLLPARAWELLTGALLAVVGSRACAGSPGRRAPARLPPGWWSSSSPRSPTTPRRRSPACRGPARCRHRARHRRRLRPARPPACAPCWAARRCCGWASAPTPSTCGTGRRWCSSPRVGPAVGRPAPGRRRRLGGPGGAVLPPRRGPVRHSSWIAARPRRSLLPGLSLLVVPALLAVLLLAVPRSTSGGTRQPPHPARRRGARRARCRRRVDDRSRRRHRPGAADQAATSASTTSGHRAPSTPAPPRARDRRAAAAPRPGADDAGGAVEPAPEPDRRCARPARLYDVGCVLDPGAIPPGLRLRRRLVAGDRGHPRRLARRALVPGAAAASAGPSWRLLYFAKKGCPPSDQPLRNGATRLRPVARRGAGQDHGRRPALMILTGYHYATAGGAVGRTRCGATA